MPSSETIEPQTATPAGELLRLRMASVLKSAVDLADAHLSLPNPGVRCVASQIRQTCELIEVEFAAALDAPAHPLAVRRGRCRVKPEVIEIIGWTRVGGRRYRTFGSPLPHLIVNGNDVVAAFADPAIADRFKEHLVRCVHDYLNEDGICRACGADCRRGTA